MIWNIAMRPAIHEAGHVVVDYVLSDLVRVAEYVGVGTVLGTNEPIWEGRVGPALLVHKQAGEEQELTPQQIANLYAGKTPVEDPWSRENTRAAMAGLYAGKVAVAAATYRGVLVPAPASMEVDPGNYGFAGVGATDQGRITEFSQKFFDSETLRDEAFALSVRTVADHFQTILDFARWIVDPQQDPNAYTSVSGWPHPVIRHEAIKAWLDTHVAIGGNVHNQDPNPAVPEIWQIPLPEFMGRYFNRIPRLPTTHLDHNWTSAEQTWKLILKAVQETPGLVAAAIEAMANPTPLGDTGLEVAIFNTAPVYCDNVMAVVRQVNSTRWDVAGYFYGDGIIVNQKFRGLCLGHRLIVAKVRALGGKSPSRDEAYTEAGYRLAQETWAFEVKTALLAGKPVPSAVLDHFPPPPVPAVQYIAPAAQNVASPEEPRTRWWSWLLRRLRLDR